MFRSYQHSDVHEVLKAYGLAEGPTTQQNPTQHHYWYPFDEFSQQRFQQDFKDYQRATNSKLKSRRVCFLLNTPNPSALVLQFEDPNNEPEASVSKSYAKLSALWLTSPTGGVEDQALISLLKNLCAGKIQVQRQLLPDEGSLIALTENIVQIFSNSKTQQFSPEQAFLRHSKQRLLSAFGLATVDKAAIVESMLVLRKYQLLSCERIKRERGIEKQDPEAIRALLAFDRQVKQALFQVEQLSSPAEGFSAVSESIVTQLVATDVAEWTPILQEARLKAIREAQHWEEEWTKLLQHQSWSSYVWGRCYQLAKQVYQGSFVALGSELFQWMGKKIMRTRPNAIPSSQGFRRWQEPDVWLQISGGGVGLLCSYWMGSYTLCRMALVNLATVGLHEISFHYRMQDQSASLSPSRFDIVTYSRLTSAVVTLSEAMYFQDGRYVVRGLSGIGGSLGATEGVKYFFPSLGHSQQRSEDQVYLMLFVSTAGHQLTSSLSEFGMNIMDRVQQKLALQAFVVSELEQQSELQDVEVRMRSLATHPELWLNEHVPMEVEWHDAMGWHYRTFCEARVIAQNRGEMECTPFERSVPRLK